MTTPSEYREIDPPTAKRMLDDRIALLFDIREADEYAREHIPGAELRPLSSFDPRDFPEAAEKAAIFHCGSGVRTRDAAARIARTGFSEIYHLQGGLAAWKGAGLPVNVNRTAPIGVMRQVQITAGTLVVAGVVMALVGSAGWLLLSAAVGFGLVFAGVSGRCPMAAALARMPWNRPAGG